MSMGPSDEVGLPCLTHTLPGVGGVIKRYNEDFVVEEIPLYQPCGEGTHVYFTLEKQGLTTPAAIGLIARALGRKPYEFGYAGLKDAHAVTRQTVSLEHVDPQRLESLELARIRIEGITRHRNKIKLGHLAGNRFIINIRHALGNTGRATPATRLRHRPLVGTESTPAAGGTAVERAAAILAVLARRGVPNTFGPQRFGARGDNWQIGWAMLRGDYDDAAAIMLGRPGPQDRGPVEKARRLFDEGKLDEARRTWPPAFRPQARLCQVLIRNPGDCGRAWRSVDRDLRKLYLNAFQSHLFNRVLAQRIDGLDRLEPGDMAYKHANGACFMVEDAEREQPRCAAFEISPTGPLYGRRMTPAAGEPGRREAEVLERFGLADRTEFRTADGTTADGARRPLRVPLGEYGVAERDDEHGAFLQLSFTLPPGAYATCVTREVCKTSDVNL